MQKAWKRLTRESYIEKAHKVHSGYYSYENMVFSTVNSKITITCPIHGDFEQNAAIHLNGSKCRICSMDLRSKNRTSTTEAFIKECTIVHNNRYSYGKTVYTKSADKVVITCQTHGDFAQIANLHKRGSGCPKCAREVPTNSWQYTEWEKFGTKSKNFIGFYVYILRCFNEEEEFYKVGKTFVDLAKRYECKAAMPYSYLVMDTIHGDARTVSELETYLHNAFKSCKYTPNMPFSGHTETFLVTAYSDIQKEIHEFKQTYRRKEDTP